MAHVTIAAVVGAIGSASLAAQGGITDPKQGKGGSIVKGAAGTAGSKGDTGLEHCEKPMGALVVAEPQSEMMAALSSYKLQSPVSLIRMMIQQSNCFIVVERGLGMQNLMQERQLAEAGQSRAGSNMGGGQMMTADYVLTPTIVFSENNAGGIGAAAGALFGRVGSLVAGGLKFKEAQTSMLLADTRSSVQVASAEGSTKKADMGFGAALLGGGLGGAVGGYGNTNEGKIIAAAFMNNYNKLVGVVRDDPSLQRQVSSLAVEAAKGGSTKAGAVFEEGDVLVPKVGAPMRADAADAAKVVATLTRTDEVVVTGESRSGYVQVTTGTGASGWVKIVLMMKKP